MAITRDLRVFDLIEFDGTLNVASVRKIVTDDGERVAILRYMKDDGELDFSPFTMSIRAITKICTIVDAGARNGNTRRPAIVGFADKERAKPGAQEARPKFHGALMAMAKARKAS